MGYRLVLGVAIDGYGGCRRADATAEHRVLPGVSDADALRVAAFSGGKLMWTGVLISWLVASSARSIYLFGFARERIGA